MRLCRQARTRAGAPASSQVAPPSAGLSAQLLAYSLRRAVEREGEGAQSAAMASASARRHQMSRAWAAAGASFWATGAADETSEGGTRKSDSFSWKEQANWAWAPISSPCCLLAWWGCLVFGQGGAHVVKC